MRDWQHIFEAREEKDGPGGDFEACVFAKIHRKKWQRKIGLGLAAASATATLLLLAVFQPFRPAAVRGPLTATEKVEIPVSEELFFSTSDSRTRYTLQPLTLSGGAEALQAALNQI